RSSVLFDTRQKVGSGTATRRTAMVEPEKRKGSGEAGALCNGSASKLLLELRLHAGEGAVQLGADAVDDGDDRDRDAGRDEAVFDGGRAGLVLHEAHNQVLHLELHRSTRGCLSAIPEPLCPGRSGTMVGPYRRRSCNSVNLGGQTRRSFCN